MNLEGIRQALRRKPFEPFSIALADGRLLDVGHPEFVSVGNRLVAVTNLDNSRLIIEPLLIVSLDYSTPRKDGNGPPKRRRRT